MALMYPFPPDWAQRWQDKSSYVILKIVVHSGSWVGRRCLGMSASYDEYDVLRDPNDKPEEIEEVQVLLKRDDRDATCESRY
jgi:hypothetical protein